MEFEVNKIVMTFEGKPFLDDSKPQKEMSYGEIMGSMLMAADRDEKSTKKFECYGIAKKIYGKDKISLTATEIVTILEKSGKFGAPFVHGRIKEFLEPEEKKE